MLTPDYLKVLYDYHYWATGRVLETAARLEAADLDATLLAGLGSLRQILVHALSAEWIWRSRLGGVSPTAMLDPAELLTLAAIRARWADEEAALRAIIAGLDATALNQEFAYQTTTGKVHTNPRWQILAQVANHGTQHRSEAAALLTALGQSPGDLDMIVFFRTKSSAS